MKKKLLVFGLFWIMLMMAAVTEVRAGNCNPQQFSDMPQGGLEEFIAIDLPEETVDWTGESEIGEDFGDKNSEAGHSEWDRYSTNFFYNQLTEQEKQWWDTLEALGNRYLTGTKTLTDYGTYTLDSGYTTDFYRTETVRFEGLSCERAVEIMYMFRYSNPQYYFFRTLFYRSQDESGIGGAMSLTVYTDFADGAKRAQITRELQNKIDVWVAEIQAEKTELQKEKKAHDLICNQISYDQNYQDDKLKNPYNQSIYSVFFTDSTVCAGYAQTMLLLMNAVGIDCGAVTGAGHEWNLIRLNDTWYYVDVTWDDLDCRAGRALQYTYFNRSMDRLLGLDDYSRANHTVLGYWQSFLPKSTKDSGADETNIGTVYEPKEQMPLPSILAKGGTVSISSSGGGDIYYTTDGSEPSVAAEKAVKYKGSFSAEEGTTIKAIAVGDGYWDSEVAAAECGKQEEEKDSEMVQRPESPIICTVQFYTHSGSKVPSQEVKSGGWAKRPADPVWEGYQFCGWYADPGYFRPYDFGTAVTSDLVIYAKWSRMAAPATCTVRFETNGGSSVPSQGVISGNRVQVPPAPQKAGYRFAGWYTTSDCSKAYNFAKAVTENITLYAKWQGLTYRVKLDANGGYIGKKSVKSQKVTVVNGSTYQALSEAKRKGYVFLGWFTGKTEGKRLTKGDKAELTADVTLYAHWAKVNPRKVTVSSVKSTAAGKMTVRIRNQKNASGYEIRYSTKSSMASFQKVKVTDTVKTISKLKKGRKYYVQVRMYQKESVSGKIYYGTWSSKKTVNVRKK